MNTQAWESIDKRLAEQVAELKHIDLYNQQYVPDEEGKTHPYNRPAVFIEFGPTVWDEDANGTQSGPGILRVHVVMECYRDSSNLNKRSNEDRTKMLQHYGIVNKVHKALHGWQACNTLSPMVRVNRNTDHDFDNIIVELMEYTFTDYDASADVQGDWVEQPINRLKIEPSIVEEIENPYSTAEE